jgi:hypothetical protein
VQVTAVTAADGGALRAGAVLAITGSGFAATNEVHVRTRAAKLVLGAGSPFLLAQAATAIEVQLPPGGGTGEAYVSVVAAGELSSPLLVTIAQ